MDSRVCINFEAIWVEIGINIMLQTGNFVSLRGTVCEDGLVGLHRWRIEKSNFPWNENVGLNRYNGKGGNNLKKTRDTCRTP